MRIHLFPTSLRVAAVLAAGALIAPISIPVAEAQSTPPLGGRLGSGTGLDYLNPVPKQPETKKVEHPKVPGLPQGVTIDRVEWLTDRRVALFINSPSMPEHPIQVQILLARDWHSQPNRKFPEVWALDGLRAIDKENGWTIFTNIEKAYADKNVNVILPVGGASSFYSDWQRPNNGKNYQWETFLTQELPTILKKEYRSNDKRAIIGLSMGATGAMNIAEHHPEMFDFVGSFSGYLDTTTPGMPAMITAAMIDGGGYDSTAMWGPLQSPDWHSHDPKQHIDALKGKTVYVSAGSGRDDYGEPNSPATGPSNAAGIGLEVVSRLTSETFERAAQGKGLNLITRFRPSGVHNWPYWQFEMNQAFPYVADALQLAPEDRTAKCSPIGDIAKATTSGSFGNCLNDEYDVPGGKAEDFTGGRSYWSPQTGAHVLIGRINARYSELGGPGSWLGFPLTEERPTANGVGRFAEFQNGFICWSPETGAQAVRRDFFDHWGKSGWENGVLGWPVSEPKDENGTVVQDFQGGKIFQHNGHIVHTQGKIGEKYPSVAKNLGAPTTDEIFVRGGVLQHFDNGSIYWNDRVGAHVIYDGAIRDAWGQAGWEQGEFGWPTSDQQKIPAGGETINFEHGTIRQVNGQVQKEKR